VGCGGWGGGGWVRLEWIRWEEVLGGCLRCSDPKRSSRQANGVDVYQSRVVLVSRKGASRFKRSLLRYHRRKQVSASSARIRAGSRRSSINLSSESPSRKPDCSTNNAPPALSLCLFIQAATNPNNSSLISRRRVCHRWMTSL
jgi:hypothetical protein